MNTIPFHFLHRGSCPVCEQNVEFFADGPFFRNTLKCSHCKTLPRHRALFHVLKTYNPNWGKSALHECSPGWDYVSQRLVDQCPGYIASQYDLTAPRGSVVHNPRMPCKQYRSEYLEQQTFKDESFDLVITQDVFEHLFRSDKAIKEIARTLKPGGAFISTVPIVRGTRPTQRRARMVDGIIRHILAPEYHGNPVDNKGSLVTVDWGYDIVSYLQYHSGLSFLLFQFDNIDLGIRANLNDVLMGIKQPIWDGE